MYHPCVYPWWPEQVSYPLELEIQVTVNHSTWVTWNLGHLEEEKTLLSYLSQFILNNSFLTIRTKDNNWLGDFRDMDPPSEQFGFLSLAKSQKCLWFCPSMSGRQGFQKGSWSLVSFSLSPKWAPLPGSNTWKDKQNPSTNAHPFVNSFRVLSLKFIFVAA